MERLTERCWRNLDPWECCGQDDYCKRTSHETGGCFKGCIVPKIYRKLAKYEDAEEQPKFGEWIPVEEHLPDDDRYVLMSFANFTVPMIGRYQRDKDDGGNWYLGDCDEEDTCLANDLFVNAWMPLPVRYEEE